MSNPLTNRLTGPAASDLAVDARSLDSLKREAARDPQAAVKKAAVQFESLFMQMVLKSMREATPKSGLFESPAQDMYTGMLDQQLTNKVAGNGTGLADVIARQLTRHMKGVEPSVEAKAVGGAGLNPLLNPAAQVRAHATALGAASRTSPEAITNLTTDPATQAVDNSALEAHPHLTLDKKPLRDRYQELARPQTASVSRYQELAPTARSDELRAAYLARADMTRVVEARVTGPQVNEARVEAPTRSSLRAAPTQSTLSLAAATQADSKLQAGHSKRREFVDRHWHAAVAAEQATGIPAKFVLSQAALESGWGKQQIRGSNGEPSHNLFGIKAGSRWQGRTVEVATTEYENGVAKKVVEKFRAYGSVKEAFEDWAKLMANNPRYAKVLEQARSATGFAAGLQRAGYATDPHYAIKLARVIDSLG